ncbi:MAG: phosphomannomutase/phosphoglucomutase [Candidatus Coatesbacteria bacterium]|nr:phosphomannomutase/phosphoglucomutase [Candidatus Coatesbacteria bacterium]
MGINPQIFREYDIRGTVDQDLMPEVIASIGRAFGTEIMGSGLHDVVVGRDVRLSSPGFSEILIEAILSTGCNVTDIGLVPTPVFYFSLHHLDLDGGIMITGSHNPPQFNGFKICKGKHTIFGEEIQGLRGIIEKGDFTSGRGELSTRQVEDDYVDYLFDGPIDMIGMESGRKVKVVVDAGNGTASELGPAILKRMGCEVVPLFCDFDGSFPNHFPDPTVEENLEALSQKVVETCAMAGIAFDGDADRIGVVDEKGRPIWGDILLLLYARQVIASNPGAKVISEVKCSYILEQEIERLGGKSIMWRTGHSLIERKVIDEKALLAGEMSGHMYFADRYLGYDDALYGACRLAEILAAAREGLGEMIDSLPKTYNTPEIRVACPDEDKFRVVEAIAKELKKDHKVIDIDGARVVFDKGWGLIRASNTQPVLVLRFEAETEELLEAIKADFKRRLANYPSVEISKAL